MGDEGKEGGRRRSSKSKALMEKYPRDLLQRFIMSSGSSSRSDDNNNNTKQSQYHQEPHDDEEEEEVELNLGLSLGGRFGVDKHAKNKLMRSSSIVGTMPLVRDDDATMPASYPTLMRTSSLPAETEEEWRKRKELQTLRRMEAKRRRSEKQRISKAEREGGGGGGLEEERCEMEGGTTGLSLRDKQQGSNRFGSSTVAAPPFGLPSWAAAARQVVLGDVLAKGKVGLLGGSGNGSSAAGFQGFAQPSSQGSVDSQGGSSSGMSEMDGKPSLGSSSCGEARSPGSSQSLQERSSQDAMGSSGTKTNESMIKTSRAEMENPSKKSHPSPNTGREIGTNSVEDMPCVFTKGDGPNGRRIEGILYKYGKGEEVRIMCVCHGNFLSPAEFVKHAGGGDVAHPLRHIVVNPAAAPFL